MPRVIRLHPETVKRLEDNLRPGEKAQDVINRALAALEERGNR